MAKVDYIQTSFAAGEFGPSLFGRTDIAQYANACQIVENFLPRPYGSVISTPGTKYVATVSDSTLKTRLIKFVFNRADAYVIEMGEYYFRFYTNGGVVVTTGTTPFQLAHIYSEDEIFDVQFTQLNDIIWMTHPDHPPQKLVRSAAASWAISDFAFKGGPFMDDNTDDSITITPSATTGTINITVSPTNSSLFTLSTSTLGHHNAYWMIGGLALTNATTLLQEMGYVKITHVINSYTATATVIKTLKAITATAVWAEGAWSAVRGYPARVTFHERRLFMARTAEEPQKVWGSKVFIYDNFALDGAGDDDGLNLALASNESNEIQWLTSGKSLIAGTYGGAFVINSGSTEPITPSNANASEEVGIGSESIVPKKIGNFLYYVQRFGKKLREMFYFYDLDTYKAVDRTILAPHILGSGVIDMDYQQNPDSVLYCVLTDGTLATLTREVDQEVQAWARQTTDGDYKSIAIIPSQTNSYDEVWVIVKRTINGSTKQYVEYFQNIEVPSEQEQCLYVHSGLTLNDPKTITNVTTKKEIDSMEVYTSDALAQANWVTNKAAIDWGYAGIFNGSTSYLTVPDHADWAFGTGDFTVDFWVRWNSVADSQYFIGQYVDGTHRWYVGNTGGNNIHIEFRDVSAIIDMTMVSNWSPSAGTWYHIAAVRSGATTLLFINGVSQAMSGTSSAGDVGDLATTLSIGQEGSGFYYVNGWLDEVRISKGIARWTANFTPPTAPYASDAYTKLLLHLDYNVTDSGNTVHTVTNNNVTFDTHTMERLQCYSENTIITQGTYSLKVISRQILSSAGTLTKTPVAVIDLTGINEIKLSVRASRTGSNFKIGFHDSGGTTTEHTVAIATINTWQTETIDISGVIAANKDAIDSIIITILNDDESNTFYVDNIYSPTDKIVVTSASHGFSADNIIRITSVVGMTELNGNKYIVDYVDVDTFYLNDLGDIAIDGSGYANYISGGEARKGVTTISGLSHLEAKEVIILADGIPHDNRVVSDGTITLDDYYSYVHVGLFYDQKIYTLPREAGSARGTAQGKIQRINEVAFKLNRSHQGFKIGPDADNLDTVNLMFTPTVTSLYTGIIANLSFRGNYIRGAQIYIKNSDPLPVEILSVMSALTTEDK